ncbi:hypothetical protein ABZ639_10160 [Saccharomonospora sp. NPDC006951]
MTYYRPFAILPRFRDTSLLVLPGRPSVLPPDEALRTVHRGLTVAVFAENTGSATSRDPVAVYDSGVLIEAGTTTQLMGGRGPYADLRRAWTRGENP